VKMVRHTYGGMHCDAIAMSQLSRRCLEPCFPDGFAKWCKH